MNESEIERLRDLYHELEQAQRKLEALLAEKQSQLKTMPRKAEAFQEVELSVDSLGYAVDDLDSVLENLEELIEL